MRTFNRCAVLSPMVIAAAALSACSGPGNTSTDAGPAPTYAPGSCATAGQSPQRDGAGNVVCSAVGASQAATTGDWPDVTSAARPIVYVQPGATGGDGTQAHPVGDLDAALAITPTAATIVISRGNLTLAHPVHLNANVALIGAGPSATTMAALAGATAIEISGSNVRVSVTGLTIQYPAGAVAGDSSAGVDATAGSIVTVSNVLVSGSHDGVRAMGATLHVDHTTVRSGQRHGVLVTAGSDATIDTLWVSDTSFSVAGDGVGVAVANSHCDITSSLITDNQRDGLVFMGGLAGMTNHVTQVVSLRNGVTAMRADGANCVVQISKTALSGTLVPAGTVGGDGLFITNGAQVAVDMDITGAANRGFGTELVGNARTGILVNGTGTTFAISGARIGSNIGPGLFMQDSAHASAVEFSDIGSNGGLGIGVTAGASAVEMTGNSLHHVQSATLMTSAGAVTIGDGLSMAEGTMSANVVANDFSQNARFGAVFSGANATLSNNTGAGNLYGVGAYAATVAADSTNHVAGSMDAPTAAPPTARGTVGF